MSAAVSLNLLGSCWQQDSPQMATTATNTNMSLEASIFKGLLSGAISAYDTDILNTSVIQ